MELPIPVDQSSESNTSNRTNSLPSDSSIRLITPSTDAGGVPLVKQKSASRTVRIASSMRRKPTGKGKVTHQLPKDPAFVFSNSGHSLLLWDKEGDYVARFDIPSNGPSAIQGCRYNVSGIQTAAAGNYRCAVVSALNRQDPKLIVFGGGKVDPEHETNIKLLGRLGAVCLAISRNDKFAAVSVNDSIYVYELENGIRLVPFHHQTQAYEMRGGTTHRRTISIGRATSEDSLHKAERTDTGWFGTQSRGLSYKEAAEEQLRQTAIVSRKIQFSPDSERLIVATQLGDHCVYVNVWDCTQEPVTQIPECARSFKLPPWTLNDGDLTSVFYDSIHRSAIVTAFLGKEYPLLLPFPGYDALQNETYSTKIVHAAQSPSGQTFVVANAMTEIIQFEYNLKNSLSPRRLKMSSSKIPSSVFKPGTIALAMPQEDLLLAFWIKDGKCMLRTVKIGASESWKELDIRGIFERLMELQGKAVIARAPSLRIQEMDGT